MQPCLKPVICWEMKWYFWIPHYPGFLHSTSFKLNAFLWWLERNVRKRVVGRYLLPARHCIFGYSIYIFSAQHMHLSLTPFFLEVSLGSWKCIRLTYGSVISLNLHLMRFSLSYSNAQSITLVSPLKIQNKVQLPNLALRDPHAPCGTFLQCEPPPMQSELASLS